MAFVTTKQPLPYVIRNLSYTSARDYKIFIVGQAPGSGPEKTLEIYSGEARVAAE